MKNNKKMVNVLTLGLTGSDDVYRPVAILSSEVNENDTQASIVEYCLICAAGRMEEIRADDLQVEFVKESYSVKDTVKFKFENLEQVVLCEEMFVEKINSLALPTDLEEVSGAADFLDNLSEMVAEFENMEGVTVTIVSNILEKI